ncbi:MAG: ABC transporter ATP-binding protein/permease [Clostridiales bacterium]|nr:ABC transporter ATP-binding protein/permease [Clostridiales bacterium]
MIKTLKYLKPYSGTVAAGLIFKFVGSVSELFLPLILDYIIDEVVPVKDTDMLIILGAAMLGFSVLAMVSNIVANRLAAKSSGKMTRDLRYDLFRKTSSLTGAQVDAFTLPSLVSRLTSDTYYVNQSVAQSLRLGVRAPILLLGGLALTFVLDWRLALVLLACVPFVTIAVVLITKKSVPMYTKVQKSGDVAVRAMQENITGVRVIKALSKTGFEVEKFRAVNDNLTADEFKTNRLTSLTNPLATLILNAGLVGVIAVGAAVGAQAGTVLAFLSFFTIILNAMLGISKIFVTLSRGVASAERVEKVLSTDGAMPVSDYPEGDSENAFEFRDVSFSYNGKESNLHGVSFAVKRGQTVGIIGGTGSGKTTIINLLMRFYDVGGGAVYVDGKDVRSYPEGDLRVKFGAAFQNDFLIASTVRENIDYFRGLPEGNILKAAEVACAAEFIAGLDGGLDYTLAQKAANLSGGQKQRLLIARALAAEPEILVLDDSSSALDYATDAKLRKGLKESYPDCTKLIVAQRVSAVKNADLIIVMDDGRIAGAGTHEELMESCEEYSQICLVQTGGDL